MGIDPQHVDRYRQLQSIFYNKISLPGRNVQGCIVLQLQEHGMLRRSVICEVKSNACANALLLPGRFQVHIQHEIIPRIQPPRHALRLHQRCGVGLPKKEVTIRIEALPGVNQDVHPRHPTLPVLRMRSPQRPRRIHNYVGVMHDAW